jgi:hypothetical protein
MIADWGTIPIWNFSFENRLAMAKEIELCWPVLQWIRTLPDGTLSDTVMPSSILDVLSNSTRLLPEKSAKTSKGQLSFVSKYLHLCINDTFPIWDSNALRVLGGNENRTWPSYGDWLNRVRQTLEEHKECLRQVRVGGESLVRTLDKALYTIGGKPRDLA